ncbi:hypothetical protein C0J52_18813 [Blattella germanica]|nr:hypothetical protein C0J52_18813 [Blattella germanica]
MVSLMGMFVYRLVISNDANVALCGIDVSLISLSRCVVFLIEEWLLDFMLFFMVFSMYLAGAGVWLISGLMGVLGLCILGRAMSVGTAGFICFRCCFLRVGKMCLLLFMVFLICVWHCVVASYANSLML